MRSEQGLSGGGHPYLRKAMEAGRVDADIPGEAEKTAAEFRHVLQWQGEDSLECKSRHAGRRAPRLCRSQALATR